ncbi:MAG: thiazole synthase [Kiritimatiellae bacterium]|nr:thiazole synthase [Kiritimatiellia bacterium]
MWKLGSTTLNSRLMIGTAQYPSPEIMAKSIKASEAEIVTVSLRRQNPGEKGGELFWNFIKDLNLKILPNTAGCRTVQEANTTAEMARELFGTNWIKLEVIGDEYTLQPDTTALIEAAQMLVGKGFEVLPYTTEDLIVAQRLVNVGCKILMPWAAPIGSGQGLLNPYALRTLRKRLPDITLIIDAGLGRPSHAVQVMEMGFDGVLINSAVALAQDPIDMARAFARGVEAGRMGYKAGLLYPREMASPSTPTIGTPFWQQEKNGD